MTGPARGFVAAFALLVGAGVASPAAAQDAPVAPRPGSAAPTTGGWGAVDVAPRPGNTTVSVTLAFPHGSADDPADASGATWFLGQVIRAMVEDGLDPAARAATEIAVEVDRSRTYVRMVSLPRYWAEAYGVLEWATLRATPTAAATERARAGMSEVFRFERDAPHREFEVELYRLLAGPTSSWNRLPRGDAATVERLGPSDLSVVRDRVFVKGDGVVSVVGAVEPEVAARTVTGGPSLPEGGLASPDHLVVGERPGGPTLWDARDRLLLTREVTSSWIGVAWPIDAGTSRTAREMLVDRLDREFNPSPPDPGAFNVDVRLELMGAHELLVVEAAVLPEAVDAWERRILAAVDEIGTESLDGPFFRAYLRRFRGARLLRDAPPEVESLRRADDLLFLGRVRDLAAEISGLEADDLRDAAAALAQPRVFILGPDLSDGSAP